MRSVPCTVPWPYLVGPLDPLHVREVDLEKRRPEGKLDLRAARSRRAAWDSQAVLGAGPLPQALSGPALQEQPAGGAGCKDQAAPTLGCDTDRAPDTSSTSSGLGCPPGWLWGDSSLPSPLAHRLEPIHSLVQTRLTLLVEARSPHMSLSLDQ